MGKMGKKVYGKRGKSIRYNTLSAYCYHCFLHIKLNISCYILHDSVMTASSLQIKKSKFRTLHQAGSKFQDLYNPIYFSHDYRQAGSTSLVLAV